MKLLKKQPIAILIALIIVLGATFYGANRSLGAEVRQAANQFYDGVFDTSQNRTLPSIYGQLEQRATASLRMLAIGEHSHGDEPSLTTVHAELRDARRVFVDLLLTGSPRELFEADQALEAAVSRYFAILHPLVVEAEGEDLQALESAQSTMQNAARVIRESGYNEAIRSFHQNVLGGFPASLLMQIVFVNPPELFA